MFETNIVIVGNVLTAPEWRRTAKGTLVTNFRVASTARRLDRETGRWVDGDSLRVRVTCWRRLAEGVSASIAVGDPVVVVGRLFTRDWTDADGNAVAVRWWRWKDVDTYPGDVSLSDPTALATRFQVPNDAAPGQTIQLVLEATDDGTPALTRYQRVVVSVTR